MTMVHSSTSTTVDASDVSAAPISEQRIGCAIVPMMPCPCCNHAISALQGSKDAICTNCGFKLPCCGD